jgi:hypothetical protein
MKEPLHVLIIDPDTSNGNVKIAHDQLARYQTIQKEVRGGAVSGPFFRTSLNRDHGSDSLFFQYPAAFTPFATTIRFNEQREEHRDLLELLYDEDDLRLSFEKGYIGRAHIGSVDLYNVLKGALVRAADEVDASDSDPSTPLRGFFKELRAAAQDRGARLMVAGSVFGGTGASGLPATPPLIREMLGEELSENVTMGCLQLAPYFSFPQGQSRDPDSTLHPIATQSALFHYAYSDTGYSRLYLLGAPRREQTSQKNRPGGADQRNDAHYVELAAALAASHFFEGVADDELGETEVLACGADQLEWKTLPHGSAVEARRNLVSFATFSMLHAHFLSKDLKNRGHLGYSWAHQLALQSRKPLGGQEATLSDLSDFCRQFLKWAAEVDDSASASLFTLSKGDPAVAELARISGGGTVDERRAYHELINHLNQVKRADGESASGWYVDALTQAVDKFCGRHYQTWW